MDTKVLYVKYNPSRRDDYLIETSIYESNGRCYVKKEALTVEAKRHIKRMDYNYNRLLDINSEDVVRLTPIVDRGEDYIVYEYVSGDSLYDMLCEYFYSDAKDNFINLIDRYYYLLVKFLRPTDIFTTDDSEIFLFDGIDMDYIKGLANYAQVSYFDLIFSNIISTGQDYVVIDYEWLFNTSLPIHYIFYRALKYGFYGIHLSAGVDVNDCVEFTYFMDKYGICEDEIKTYDMIERNLQRHVSGEKQEIAGRYREGKEIDFEGEMQTLQREVAVLRRELDLFPHRVTSRWVDIFRKSPFVMKLYNALKG